MNTFYGMFLINQGVKMQADLQCELDMYDLRI